MTKETPKEYTLTRTGKPPLRFTGTLLAHRDETDGKSEEDKRPIKRWHEINVYKTKSKYVVEIIYHTTWQAQGKSQGRRLDEFPYHVVLVVDTPAEVIKAMLTDYDPTSQVVGYPPNEAYAAKQELLLSDVRTRYEILVSEVLASSPEFAERID